MCLPSGCIEILERDQAVMEGRLASALCAGRGQLRPGLTVPAGEIIAGEPSNTAQQGENQGYFPAFLPRFVLGQSAIGNEQARAIRSSGGDVFTLRSGRHRPLRPAG